MVIEPISFRHPAMDVFYTCYRKRMSDKNFQNNWGGGELKWRFMQERWRTLESKYAAFVYAYKILLQQIDLIVSIFNERCQINENNNQVCFNFKVDEYARSVYLIESFLFSCRSTLDTLQRFRVFFYSAKTQKLPESFRAQHNKIIEGSFGDRELQSYHRDEMTWFSDLLAYRNGVAHKDSIDLRFRFVSYPEILIEMEVLGKRHIDLQKTIKSISDGFFSYMKFFNEYYTDNEFDV